VRIIQEVVQNLGSLNVVNPFARNDRHLPRCADAFPL
jgi:hypothetical protein